MRKRRNSYNRSKNRRKTRKQRIRERNRAILLLILAFVGIIVVTIAGYRLLFLEDREKTETAGVLSDEEWEGAPALDVQLLTMNEYSRPGIALEKINGIVIHYTANPGTSAQANRDYFENLKDSHTTKVSSHFIVGLEGEVVQCIPSTEIAYASNDRNADTLSIEICHPDETGQFTEATYQSAVELTGWLCKRFDLTADDVIRHYDVTGKICPKYFVDHEDAWSQFKIDVQKKIETL